MNNIGCPDMKLEDKGNDTLPVDEEYNAKVEKRWKFIKSKKDYIMIAVMIGVFVCMIYIALQAHALSTDPCQFCMENFGRVCYVPAAYGPSP